VGAPEPVGLVELLEERPERAPAARAVPAWAASEEATRARAGQRPAELVAAADRRLALAATPDAELVAAGRAVVPVRPRDRAAVQAELEGEEVLAAVPGAWEPAAVPDEVVRAGRVA
jgi:hypothetical protein